VPVVRVLLGPAYLESASVLRILIWAVLPMYLNYAMNVALLAVGRERVFLATSITCLLFNLVSNLIFIPHFGWRAAAIITLMTELILFFKNLFWFRRVLGTAIVPERAIPTSLPFLLFWSVTIFPLPAYLKAVIGPLSLAAFVVYLHKTGM